MPVTAAESHGLAPWIVSGFVRSSSLGPTLDHLIGTRKDSDSTQSGTSGTRVSLDDLVEKINKGRRKILLAAEGAGPSDNPANAPIRREFDLPPNRPYVG